MATWTLLDCPCCPQSGSGSGESGSGTFVEVPCCPGVLIPRTLHMTIDNGVDPPCTLELTYYDPPFAGTGGWATYNEAGTVFPFCAGLGCYVGFLLYCDGVVWHADSILLCSNSSCSAFVAPCSGSVSTTPGTTVCSPFYMEVLSATPPFPVVAIITE